MFELPPSPEIENRLTAAAVNVIAATMPLIMAASPSVTMKCSTASSTAVISTILPAATGSTANVQLPRVSTVNAPNQPTAGETWIERSRSSASRTTQLAASRTIRVSAGVSSPPDVGSVSCSRGMEQIAA